MHNFIVIAFAICVHMVSKAGTLLWTTYKGAHPLERIVLLPPVVSSCL